MKNIQKRNKICYCLRGNLKLREGEIPPPPPPPPKALKKTHVYQEINLCLVKSICQRNEELRIQKSLLKEFKSGQYGLLSAVKAGSTFFQAKTSACMVF